MTKVSPDSSDTLESIYYFVFCAKRNAFVSDLITSICTSRVCLWLWGGRDYRRHGGAGGDDSGGQQDDDEDDDEDDHHDDHDQLDVLPPEGASHFLRRLLEMLSLSGERREDQLISDKVVHNSGAIDTRTQESDLIKSV